MSLPLYKVLIHRRVTSRNMWGGDVELKGNSLREPSLDPPFFPIRSWITNAPQYHVLFTDLRRFLHDIDRLMFILYQFMK